MVIDNITQLNHVLISKKYRIKTILGIKLKNDVSDSHLANSLKYSLEETYEKHIIYIAKIKKFDIQNIIENEENFIEFKVLIIYFTIPKQLIEQLINNQMNKCIFYINNSEDIDKILILNQEPDDNSLALNDLDNEPSPFKTVELTFEIEH